MATRSVPQPPFPAELLADLHAGNVAPDLGEQLWPAVQHNPEAQNYLHSLDEVRVQLRELGRGDAILHPMPSDVGARLELLAEHLGGNHPDAEATLPFATPSEQAPPNPVAAEPIPLHSRRRNLRLLAAAAAAIVAATCAAFIVDVVRDGTNEPVAAPPSATADTAEPGITSAVALRALGRNDVSGRLAEPAALTGCVRAAGMDSGVLGSTDMRYQGRDAVLILVGGGKGTRITALVVGPGCGPSDPQVLAVTDIG